ncbi:Os06g0102800 [Oryza sativa Japonica Group]|uniref:Os06g0102800 protein n=1 Tax=Oryza sativa subsp. japonica TaxID=39947 RepID=Q0DFC3_ORYSJ|nr:Os06g0102800 [Oryza sativa Japonica Group]|eukprot:NP_001056536.1 Os06g0102800 [Oryza sativa Japonica Group]
MTTMLPRCLCKTVALFWSMKKLTHKSKVTSLACTKFLRWYWRRLMSPRTKLMNMLPLLSHLFLLICVQTIMLLKAAMGWKSKSKPWDVQTHVL